jgi:type I restriction enzyme S subunit
VRLGDVCQKTETINPQNTPNEEFTYVDVSSVSNQTFSIETPTRIFGRDAPSRARRLIRTGDVVFATVRPTLMRVAQVPSPLDEAVCSTGYIVLRPRPELDARFLFYSLFRPSFQGAMESLQSGASYPAVNDGQVLTQPMLLPPLEEQKRIVAVLDQTFAALDRARANAEANLADAQSLFVASIRQRFESDVAEFGSVDLNAFAEHVTDGDHQPPPKVATGVPFITISNIDKVSRCIGFSDTFYVSEEYFQRLNDKRRAKSGDILYTVTGSFGIPVLVSEECGDFCFQRHIGLIRPKPSVNSKWLSYMLGCPQVYEQADDGATGTAQRTVSLKVLRRLQVPNAPESKQRAAVRELDVLSDRCRTLASFYQSKLAGLAALRQSLLQKAFAGELT